MIKLENVYKIYNNAVVAVNDVSLEFLSNGFIGIIGSSGSGKSTLLNLLSNNDIQSKGKLEYNGKSYQEYDKSVLLKDFAYIHQDFKLIDNLTVYQNIKIGHELASTNIDNKFILEVANKFGLTDLLDQKVFALSGGQQQRVAIARAMVRNPKVIFADEPTGNLDRKNSENVYEILKEISKDILVVMVSHDKLISNYVDRIIELENGIVVYDCTGEEYKLKLEEQSNKFGTNSNVLAFESDNISKRKLRSQVMPNSKNYKKASKVNVKNIFSYSKGKNLNRKESGLSGNSLLGLTIAFNNKKIGKKIVLLIVTSLMVALIFATTAVLFSTNETSFCNIMKSNNVPFVTYTASGDTYKNSELEKLNNYIKTKYGVNTYATTKNSLHKFASSIFPKDNEKLLNYHNLMRPLFEDCIYINTPEDIGLKILKGNAPKINSEGTDEIAISKSCYNYFMQTKVFENTNGEIVDFSSREIIGNYIPEFCFKISGVFEDYNDIDMKSTDLSRNDLWYYNPLVYSILRPEEAITDWNSIIVQQTSYNMCVDDENIGFYSFYPDNKSAKKHFSKSDFSKISNLADNEIVVGSMFVSYYRRNKGIQLKKGDSVAFQMVKIKSNGAKLVIDEVVKDFKNFTIKEIVNEFSGIMINEQLFTEWTSELFPTVNSYLFDSKIISPKVLKEIRKFAYNDLAPQINQDNFGVSYGMIKFNGNNEFNNGRMFIAQMSVALPFCILALIIFGILLTICIVDMIKDKSRDILVLKSLGIRQNEIIKIFVGTIFVMIIVQFLIGISLGIGLTFGLNNFWTILMNYNFYSPTFYVSILSISIMIIMIIGISLVSLWYSVQRLNGKNLRKMFQKQKQ